MLQLLCEGGFTLSKNIIREQIGNSKMVALLDSLAAFIGALSKNCRFRFSIVRVLLTYTRTLHLVLAMKMNVTISST